MTDHADLDKFLREYLANLKPSRLSIRDILAEAPVERHLRGIQCSPLSGLETTLIAILLLVNCRLNIASDAPFVRISHHLRLF